jgi:hypothetical protein
VDTLILDDFGVKVFDWKILIGCDEIYPDGLERWELSFNLMIYAMLVQFERIFREYQLKPQQII